MVAVLRGPQNSSLPLTSSMALDQSPHLSETPSPPLHMGTMIPFFLDCSQIKGGNHRLINILLLQ